MSYAIYRIGKNRWGGYGVPAYCEYPGCDVEINRGMSYACGGEPFSEGGCDGYFCSKHRVMACVVAITDPDHDCEEEEDECSYKEVCPACAEGELRYPYRKEHPRFLYHLVHDFSWSQWREENAEILEEYRNELGDYKPPAGDTDTQETENKEASA